MHSYQTFISSSINTPLIQAQLKVGEPGDKYEREADAMANRVMSMPQTENSIQRACASCSENELQMKPMSEHVLQMQVVEEEEELLQPKLRMQPMEEEEEMLQPKSMGSTSGDLNEIASIMQSTGKGSSLPDNMNQFMGNAFGSDFSDVNIHTGSDAVQMNTQLGARAFTHGNSIYFNKGQYAPDSSEGKKLLAHELTHVVQQSKAKKTKQIQRSVDSKQVSCGSYKADHPTIKVIGTTTPVDTLNAANTKAISLLESTIGTLEFIRGKVSGGADPSYPTFSDCTGMSLKTRFKMNPESKSTWVGKGKTDTLIKWYKKIKDILSGDKMKYTCIDKFADCGVSSWGAAIPGQYRIYLCKPWWSASLADQGLTLIHETSHIYYNTDDHIGSTVMNAHCLEKFVAETNNIPIVKQFEKGCGGKNDSC